MTEITPAAWVERTEEGLTRMWSSDLATWANRPANPEPLYDQATVDSLRRDAKRYRWLRERWGKLEEIYECGTDKMLDIRDAEPGEGWRTDPVTLDAAIDAAMNGANDKLSGAAAGK